MNGPRHSARHGLILSHSDQGPAGLLGEWFDEHGVAYAVHDVTRAPMPRLEEAGFVVSLGSEESAVDAELEWVGDEIALLRGAIAAAVPVLGLCFGGQALSVALGGHVGPARPPQIGWLEIDGGDGELPRGPWFHWHYEQFEVPSGAQSLGRTEAGPSAFRSGPHLGLQFHPEVKVEAIAEWAATSRTLVTLGIDAAELVAESARRAPAARALAWQLFDRWWRLAADRSR